MKIMLGAVCGFVLGYLAGIWTQAVPAQESPGMSVGPDVGMILQHPVDTLQALGGVDPDGILRKIQVDREGRVIVSPESENEGSAEVYPLRKSSGPDTRVWRVRPKTERVWVLEEPTGTSRR